MTYSHHKHYGHIAEGCDMEVQIMEFDYSAANVEDIEMRLNNYFSHHDVRDVQVTQSEDKILAFCFYEE